MPIINGSANGCAIIARADLSLPAVRSTHSNGKICKRDPDRAVRDEENPPTRIPRRIDAANATHDTDFRSDHSAEMRGSRSGHSGKTGADRSERRARCHEDRKYRYTRIVGRIPSIIIFQLDTIPTNVDEEKEKKTKKKEKRENKKTGACQRVRSRTAEPKPSRADFRRTW